MTSVEKKAHPAPVAPPAIQTWPSDTPLPSAEKRLAELLQQSRIAAGSLIVTVFGDAVLPRGGGVWLGSLIALMQQLGLNERLVRTSVFRLVKDEWLHTETQGRRANYLLTATGRQRFEEAARHIYATTPPAWDRQWRMLMLVGPLETRRREALRRAMRWQGFGELSPSSFVHPGADLQECLDALAAEGMADLMPQLMPLLGAQVPIHKLARTGRPVEAGLISEAWNLDLLAQEYQAFLNLYQPLQDDLNSSEWLQESSITESLQRAAFVARTLLIHDFRRILLRDPELPAELLPQHWPGQKARLLCAGIYHRLLRASEAYLDAQLQLADGSTPGASELLGDRFRGMLATHSTLIQDDKGVNKV